MHARGQAKAGIGAHDFQGALVVGFVLAGVAHHHATQHVRRFHTRQYVRQVVHEALRGQVRVGIKQFHSSSKYAAQGIFPARHCLSKGECL